MDNKLDDALRPLTNKPMSAYNVFTRISRLAFPMALSFTFSFEVVFATIMLNMLSQSNLESAAATLVSTFMNTICVLGGSPLFSVAILLSKKLGEYRVLKLGQDDQEIEQGKQIISSFNVNALRIAAWMAVPSFLALFFSGPLLTHVFQQNSDIAREAQRFLQIYAFAIPGIFVRAAFEQIMFAFGKTTPAMFIGLINLAVGTLVAASLGFGFGAIPKLGASGIATGFLIETYLTALCFGAYVFRLKECQEFEFFKNMLQKMKQNPQVRQDIANVGGSIFFTMLVELGMLLAVGLFSGLKGAKAQAAMSYCLQFLYFQSLFIAAFSFSCAQEIGRTLGAQEYNDTSKIARYGLLTSFFYLQWIPIIILCAPQLLLITHQHVDSSVLPILVHMVPIMAVGNLFDIVRSNCLQQLRTLNDFRIPNAIAISSMIIGIVLSAVLGLKTSLNTDGIAAGFTIGMGIGALGLGLRWWAQISADRIGQVPHTNTWGVSKIRNVCSMFRERPGTTTDGCTPLLEKDPESSRSPG